MDLEDSDEDLYLPSDLYNNYYLNYLYDFDNIIKNSYRNKVHINSNSWGAEEEYSYDSFCVQTDQFVWDYNDMLILFAAGNDGAEGYKLIINLYVDWEQLLLLLSLKTLLL